MPAVDALRSRPRTSRSAIVLALLAGLLLPGSAAAAVVVGTESPWWTSPLSTVAIQPGQTVWNTSDPRPGAQLAAPSAGVITRWRTEELSGTAVVQLQVVRPTGGGTWQIVGSGPVQTAVDATATSPGGGVRLEWPARLRIAAGDHIALHQADGSFGYFFGRQQSDDATTAVFDDRSVGSPADEPEDWMATDSLIGLNADLEPDVDGDGWGDETQDRCAGLAGQDQTDTDRDGAGDVCDADDDADGLPDADEATHGSDPLDRDSDDDFLGDGDEVTRGTDPTLADTDADGIDDAGEVALRTDPRVADSDGDDRPDGADACPLTDGRGAANGCPVTRVEVPGPTVVVPPAPVPTVAFVTPAAELRLRRPRTVEVLLDVRGAAAGETVELLIGDQVLCSWTKAPYGCRWEPDGATVGSRLLMAVVRSAAGAVTAGVPVHVGRFVPESLRVSSRLARLSRARIRTTTSGLVERPREVTAEQGCSGAIEVQTLRGRAVLARRTVRLGADCRFTARTDLPASAARADKPLRVRVRFAGNRALAPLRTAPVRIERPAAAARLAACGRTCRAPASAG